MPRPWTWLRIACVPIAFALGSLMIPHCADREGQRIEADGAPVRALARTVAERSTGGLSDVGPGHALFDGEWRTVTCAFGALGLAQAAERFPEERERYAEGARSCLQALQDPGARRFASRMWGVDGGRDLHHPGGHAWLAYEGLGLATSARAFPDDPWIAERHRAVHSALVRRIRTHSPASLQTYPGQTFPPDQAVMLAALEVGGHDTSAWRARWARTAIDPSTGLLFQRLDPRTGAPVDGVRGSGTTLAAWALGIAGLPESETLWKATESHLITRGAGLAAIREVPAGAAARMDVDSGPVVLGLGLSASGFALGASRAHGDGRTFRQLHRLAWVVGAPARGAVRRRWVGGGAAGDALLLAAESSGPDLWGLHGS